MNKDDRKQLSEAMELLNQAQEIVDGIAEEIEYRIDNIMESFESGNHISERLEDEQSQLEEVSQSIETARDELEGAA